MRILQRLGWLTIAVLATVLVLPRDSQTAPAAPAAGSGAKQDAKPAPAKPPAGAAARGEQKPAPKGKKKERDVKITADDGTATYDDATGLWVTSGPIVRVDLPDSDAVLTASRIEWNQKEDWIRATGKPHCWDPHNDITAEVMRADLKTKCVTVDDSVRMVVRPKEAKTEQGKKAREDVKDPVVITCDTAQYFYKAKKGTASGNLKFAQKNPKADRNATAKRLLYDGNDETVVLDGDVHVTNTKGESIKCAQITILMKVGSEGFRMKGVTVVHMLAPEDDEEEKPAGEAKTE